MFKIIKFVIFALISTTLLIGYGCQQEAVMEQDYSNAPYLSLPSGTDFNNLTDAEIEIVMEAFSRMGIHEDEDGLLALKPRSGWEVNISENIYRYFLTVIDKSNKDIVSGNVVAFSRNGNLSRAEGPVGYGFDCMARAISSATGLDYNEVNSWIESEYGNNGVPSDQFYGTVSHFGNGNIVTPSMLRSSGKKYDGAIVVIDNSHAVNVYNADDNRFYFWDYQRGMPGSAPFESITHGFIFNN